MNKMHVDELDIDVSLVKRLIASQFPEWRDLPLKQVESAGTDNAIYRLGEDMAVRIPRILKAAKDIEKEYPWLATLASSLPLPIPMPLKKGKPDENFPWSWFVYRWLEGKNAVGNPIVDFSQAANDLGEFVSALQKVDATDGPPALRGLPLHSRDTETREAITLLKGTIDTSLATKAWEKALAIPVWKEKPVWIHADLIPTNIVVQEGKINAIIDFGSSGIGDPACDIMVAWTVLTPQTRNIFREKVRVDDATWERGRGWALTFGLVTLPYYEKTNPILAGIARHAIDAVLTESPTKK